MAYVPVPKDLTKVKTKVMFNLTKRQLICFTGGALIGVPLFFLLRKPTGNSVAAMCMMLVMLPFFMLQSHGQWGARGYNNLAPGDAIFFDWDLDGTADHVGIVIGTDGSRVYTVEGNSGDACKIKSYDLNYQSIKGYGLMNW